jgi:selenocysteine lyase/cysteine desulfurase
VIDVELSGLVMTTIPKSVVKHLGKSIETKGGIHEWAHAQEIYTSMKAKKLRKKEKRLLNSDN